jgi:PAS domain-containing protein
VSRPCRRCINLGKTDTCVDVQHKKRGRPRLRDREAAAAAAAAAAASGPGRNIALIDQRAPSGMPGQNVRGSISSNSTTSTMRQSPRSEPTTYFSGELNVLSSPTRASTIPSMAQRGRSISSSASLWSQTTPSGGIPASTPGDYTDASSSPTVSLILSTGLQCARCSVESHALLGYSPSDLIERSLFELVHPSETQRLEQLWMSLIEPVGVRSQVVPADAETVMTLSPAILMAPAPGTVYMQETMRLRQRSGIYDFYSIRLHLGGGFGADLYQTSTLDRAYIVASLLKLGNDATHPDPNLLREARWYHGNDPRHFTTPQLSSTAAAERTSGNAMIDTSEAGGYGAIGAAVDSDSPDKSYHTAASSIPNRYDWQRLDKNSRPTQAPLTQPLPPPPYSKSAYHNNNKHSSTITAPIYNNDTRKDHRLSSSSSYISSSKRKSVDQHSTTSSFSYSSNGGERGSILC